MKIMRVIWVLSLTFLMGCEPSDRLQRTYSHRTQIWQTISPDQEIFRDGRDHVSVRALILDDGGSTRHFFLSISVLRGGPNGPIIETVTSDGVPLAYRRLDRLLTACVDGCHKAEIGVVELSERAFMRAAMEGMQITMDGRRRYYEGDVAAGIFASAWRAAGLDG